MKKRFAATIAFTLLHIAGCLSTHEDRAEHHHHPKAEFEGKCAYSVMNQEYDVEGKPDFVLVHNGVTYYFADESAKGKFQEHIDQNIKRAGNNWRSGRTIIRPTRSHH